MPPKDIGVFDFDWSMHNDVPYDFRPDEGLKDWVWSTFIDEEGELCNPDHVHLSYYNRDLIGFMWASRPFEKGGHIVLGQAEQVAIMAGGWKRKRQELQMVQWFSYIPKYIITIDAGFAESASDSDFCALVEHELYHIAHKRDEWGIPQFNRETGLPKLEIKGHDVEEFTGVVRRYGASEEVQTMIDAAKQRPEISRADIYHACGTCFLKVV